MNWRTLKFDWNHARAFLATAEEGSLSAAAKALGVSQPTLSRQVSALEETLSTALFERDTRGLTLTQNGVALLEYVRTMGEAASHFSIAASGQATSIEGEIAISATELTAVFLLPAIVAKMKLTHPGIRVSIIASNEASDIKRREADIAIRNFRPVEPELITKKLGAFSATLYATKDICQSLNSTNKEIPMPALFLGYNSNNTVYINALSEKGIHLDARSFAAYSDSHQVLWEMTKAGIGAGMMPVELGDAEDNLERVYPELIFRGDIWLVSHRELRMNRRVRTVFDFLSREISAYYAQDN